MLFLSDLEKSVWADYARKILHNQAIPEEYKDTIRSNLRSAFYYYIGTMLASKGQQERGEAWLHAEPSARRRGCSHQHS